MVKLRQEHRDLIAEEVRSQLTEHLDAFQPHGWWKIAYWAREWGIAGAIITSVLALVAITLGALYQSFSHVRDESEFRTHTKDQLSGIEGRLTAIESDLLSMRTERAAADPRDKKNQAEVKTILTTALHDSITIPAPIIADSGKRFVEASANDMGAWVATLHFLNYKSFLNEAALSVLPAERLTATYNVEFIIENKVPKIPQFYVAGVVPKDQEAVFIKDGEDLNAKNSKGFQYIFAKGGSALLDGLTLRNVVFIGTAIYYTGAKSVSMENVYFINCTFSLAQNVKTRDLATALLREPIPVSFKAA
jgi:hypothetical protein